MYSGRKQTHISNNLSCWRCRLLYHYALINLPTEERQRNFWVQIGPLLSLHMIFSPLSTVGAWWWGGGRVVLQSTRGIGVYWGVAATGEKRMQLSTVALRMKRREREREREKDRAWTADHSLLRNCCSVCLTCWCDDILLFFLYRLVAVFSSEDRYFVLNSPWMQFKEQPSLRWVVFFYFHSCLLMGDVFQSQFIFCRKVWASITWTVTGFESDTHQCYAHCQIK